MYLADDLDVLRQLERPQQFDLAEDLTRYTMEKLGHVNKTPKDPRFDKTRRALAKTILKPPRGVGRPRKIAAPAPSTELTDATTQENATG